MRQIPLLFNLTRTCSGGFTPPFWVFFRGTGIPACHPLNNASPQLFLSALIKTTVIPHGVREVRNHSSLSFSFNCFPSRHP